MARSDGQSDPADEAGGTSGLQLDELIGELRQRAQTSALAQQRVAALLDAVMAVTADLELADVLARIVRAACHLVDAKYGALGVIDRDGEHLVQFVTNGLTPAEQAAIGDLPRGHGVLGLLISEPRPLRLHDISGHPATHGFPDNHPAMHTFLGAPIRLRSAVFGNLYLTEKHGGDDFTADDESMLVALAAAAGVAIENARLYERTRRQRAWIETVSEFTRRLLEGAPEHEAMGFLAAKMCEHAYGSGAFIALYDESRRLNVVGWCDAPLGRPAVALTEEPWSDLVSRGTAHLGTPHGQDFTALVVRARSTMKLSDDGPTALVPIAVGSNVLGVLALGWEPGEETVAEEMLVLAGNLAGQTGLAITAARAQQDRSRIVLLEDRDRIARDMHDHVIQRLFATGLSLQSAARLAMHPTVRDRIDQAVEDLDTAIKDIRHSIFELHRTRGASDLPEGLAAVVAQAQVALGFSATLDVQTELRDLDPGVEADVLAVTREALANVARHAAATTAGVVVRQDDDGLHVTVTDDGRGMDPESLRRSGLTNLRERARQRGGELRLESGTASGTTLIWEVPLR